MIENEMTVSVPLEVVKASEIEPKEVKWLWYPYIPFGKVTLLQGDPGDGKSKLMLSVAALLSKGEPLPFTERVQRLSAWRIRKYSRAFNFPAISNPTGQRAIGEVAEAYSKGTG